VAPNVVTKQSCKRSKVILLYYYVQTSETDVCQCLCTAEELTASIKRIGVYTTRYERPFAFIVHRIRARALSRSKNEARWSMNACVVKCVFATMRCVYRSTTRSRERLRLRCTVDHAVPAAPAQTCRRPTAPSCTASRHRGQCTELMMTMTVTSTTTRSTSICGTEAAVASADGRRQRTQPDDKDEHFIHCKVTNNPLHYNQRERRSIRLAPALSCLCDKTIKQNLSYSYRNSSAYICSSTNTKL